MLASARGGGLLTWREGIQGERLGFIRSRNGRRRMAEKRRKETKKEEDDDVRYGKATVNE